MGNFFAKYLGIFWEICLLSSFLVNILSNWLGNSLTFFIQLSILLHKLGFLIYIHLCKVCTLLLKTAQPFSKSLNYKGDEITINYAFNHSMQDFQSRHEKWIKPNWGFVCLCDRCEEEKSNLESDKTFCKKFDEIRKKAKKLHNENEIDGNYGTIELQKVMLEVLFYEEMYKMAKEKKTSWSFMIDHILDYAFDAAAQGYISAHKEIRSNFSTRFTIV